jgi:hypothetical protein
MALDFGYSGTGGVLRQVAGDAARRKDEQNKMLMELMLKGHELTPDVQQGRQQAAQSMMSGFKRPEALHPSQFQTTDVHPAVAAMNQINRKGVLESEAAELANTNATTAATTLYNRDVKRDKQQNEWDKDTADRLADSRLAVAVENTRSYVRSAYINVVGRMKVENARQDFEVAQQKAEILAAKKRRGDPLTVEERYAMVESVTMMEELLTLEEDKGFLGFFNVGGDHDRKQYLRDLIDQGYEVIHGVRRDEISSSMTNIGSQYDNSKNLLREIDGSSTSEVGPDPLDEMALFGLGTATTIGGGPGVNRLRSPVSVAEILDSAAEQQKQATAQPLLPNVAPQ